MKSKKINKIYLLCTIFFFILTICYYNRTEIIFNTLLTFGFDDNKARRYSFLISEKPYQIAVNKFRKIFYHKTNDELNISIKVKLGLPLYNSKNFEYKDGNYFLRTSKLSKTINSNQKLEYSNNWENKKPKKIWTINIFNEMTVEATPKICGKKLIYASRNGNIGAVDYRTGKKFWHKKYEKKFTPDFAKRSFLCKYDKNLNTYILLVPTSDGVICLNSVDGSLMTSRCKNGRLGVFTSRVSPQFIDNIVYIATVHPAGVEAYNFLNGRLLWRTDFEIGNAFLSGGSNPWSGFIVDHQNELIFVNTGSPSLWSSLGSSSEKYEYSNSLIALNLKNGKIIWQFKEHSKDFWDHDLVGQPILSPKKIAEKDIVITLSKSGSIYFIDRSNGMPVLSVQEKIIDFNDFKYNYKTSITPKTLLDLNYYNYLGYDCMDCNLNTKIFGSVPPILKFTRVFDGSEGGPQWPGASLDSFNNYLILPSNHNLTISHYHDFVPDPPANIPQDALIKKCTSCHDSKGKVKIKEKIIVPSLFLTTKIHDLDSLNNYLKSNKFHKDLKFNNEELHSSYNVLSEYDSRLIKNKQYLKYFKSYRTDITNKDVYSKSGPLGKITSISLETGERIWQIPAGTYELNNSKVIIGSPNYGGVTYSKNNESISFFTGSYDKKIYAINNEDGKYLWSADLPASGTAPPLIHNTSSERWIFVVATGGRVSNDKSDSIVAFRQKLN